MIKKLTITNYLGDSIVIDLMKPEQSGFAITSIDGLGPVKADINNTEVSTNDIARFNSARLNPRNIVMSIIFEETINGEDIEDIRQKSYRYFSIKKNLTFTIETNNRIVKTIGYVESNEPTIFSSREGTQISIVCPDPFLYSADPNGDNVTEFYGVEPCFDFPFSNESVSNDIIALSELRIKTEKEIDYQGDAEVGVNILIHATGEATNISIYNVITRDTLKIDTNKIESITGSGIVNGDDIVIDTNKGNKSIILIREGKVFNILNCLGKHITWPTLTKGKNIFMFEADTGTSNLKLIITNKIVYEGV